MEQQTRMFKFEHHCITLKRLIFRKANITNDKLTCKINALGKETNMQLF